MACIMELWQSCRLRGLDGTLAIKTRAEHPTSIKHVVAVCRVGPCVSVPPDRGMQSDLNAGIDSHMLGASLVETHVQKDCV